MIGLSEEVLAVALRPIPAALLLELRLLEEQLLLGTLTELLNWSSVHDHLLDAEKVRLIEVHLRQVQHQTSQRPHLFVEDGLQGIFLRL